LRGIAYIEDVLTDDDDAFDDDALDDDALDDDAFDEDALDEDALDDDDEALLSDWDWEADDGVVIR
jgi:hypothetical protein